MPRQACIGEPGALHHILIRGIELIEIFEDDKDRRSVRPERLYPSVFTGVNPLANSDVGNAQSNGNGVLRPTLLLEFPSTKASPFFPVARGWRRR